jgi:hypothetical protein
MAMHRSLSRWRRSPREWILLAEAGILLVVARAALKLLPTARIVSWVRRPLRRNGVVAGHGALEQFQWAVTAFSKNAPIRLVCFPQALAMYAMLRRRGVAAEIIYGAARLQDGKLATHAWLRSEDRLWVGAEVAEDFTVLDIWKAPSASDKTHAGSQN